MNKYLLITIGILFGACVLFYNLWDNTRAELRSVKELNRDLENEIKRRNENEKELSKKISELSRLYTNNPDWASSYVPSDIAVWLSKSCKACK